MPDGAPFVGPRPFETGEKGLFFAREAEVAELFDRLVAFRCTLLYSRSGLGKSSLIEAGLRPRLEKDGFSVLPKARVSGGIPPADADNPYVWHVLASAWGGGDGQFAKRTLRDFLSCCQAGTGAGLVLILDQFEELFKQAGTAAAREGFFLQLSDALAGLPALSVAIVIREEYLADMDAYARFLPEGLRSRMRLGPLNREAAAAALVGPLKSRDIAFHAPALEALLDFLTREVVYTAEGVLKEAPGNWAEPVQLQIVAQQLWEELPAGTLEISEQQIRRLENRDPLASFYQDCLDGAAAETGIRADKILRWCSQTLVTPAGTRALVYRGQESTAGMPNSVVDALQQRHLLRGELRAGARWIELAHDQFVRPVQDARVEWERRMSGPIERARLWMERAQDWSVSGRSSKNLLTPQEVKDAEAWLASPEAEDYGSTGLLSEFVTFSNSENVAAQQKTRALKMFMLLLAVGLVVAIAVGSWAWSQKTYAENQTLVAKRQRALADELFKQKTAALSREHEVQTALDHFKTERGLDEARHKEQQAQQVVAATEKVNRELKRSRDELDLKTRLAIAYQLKSKVQDLRNSTSDTALRQKLNFAYLAANVTFVRDKSISPEADSAMRLALPLARPPVRTTPIRGTITAGGSSYLVVSNGIASIYSLPDGGIWKSVDLRQWMGEKFSGSALLNLDRTRLLASAGSPSQLLPPSSSHVVVLDVMGDSPKPIFDEQGSDFESVVPNPAGTLLLVRGRGAVSVWSVDERRKVGSLPATSRYYMFRGDGRRLVTQDRDSIAVAESPFSSWTPLWKPREGEIGDFTVMEDGRIVVMLKDRRILRVSPDGTEAKELTKLDFPSDSQLYVDAHSTEPLVRVSTINRGSGSPYKVLDLADEAHVKTADYPAMPTIPEFLRDGRLVTTGTDGEISIWKEGTPQPQRIQIVNTGSFGISLSIRNRIAGVGKDGLVRLLEPTSDADAQRGWKPVDAKLPEGVASTVIFHRELNRALVALSNGTIWLGDPVTGQLLHAFQHGSGLFDISVDANWDRLASSGADGRIKVWDLGQEQATRTIQAHAGGVRAIALSRDGALLASAGPEGPVRVWRTTVGESDAPWRSLDTGVKIDALAFGNGEVFAGGEDGSITMWDPVKGSKRELVPAHQPASAVMGLAVDASGSRIAAGGADKTLKVYDLQSGKVLLNVDVFDSAVRRVAFDPSGLNVAGITETGAIRIDPISSVDLMTALGKLNLKPFTREECLEYARPVPDACPAK